MFFSKDHLAEEMSRPFLSPDRVHLFTTKYIPTEYPSHLNAALLLSFVTSEICCLFRGVCLTYIVGAL